MSLLLLSLSFRVEGATFVSFCRLYPYWKSVDTQFYYFLCIYSGISIDFLGSPYLTILFVFYAFFCDNRLLRKCLSY